MRRVERSQFGQILVAGRGVDGSHLHSLRRLQLIATFISHRRTAAALVVSHDFTRDNGLNCVRRSQVRTPGRIRRTRIARLARLAQTAA